MQERIYEILTFLLKKILSNEKQPVNEKLVTQDLVDKGFEIEEIKEAFRILENAQHSDMKEDNHFRSFRVFNDYEKFRLSLDAQGALILLEQFGIFTPYQLEEIIDEVMSLDVPEITQREVAFIAMEIIAESGGGIAAAKDIWSFFENSEGVDVI